LRTHVSPVPTQIVLRSARIDDGADRRVRWLEDRLKVWPPSIVFQTPPSGADVERRGLGQDAAERRDAPLIVAGLMARAARPPKVSEVILTSSAAKAWRRGERDAERRADQRAAHRLSLARRRPARPPWAASRRACRRSGSSSSD
jgi:hypothetical protein